MNTRNRFSTSEDVELDKETERAIEEILLSFEQFLRIVAEKSLTTQQKQRQTEKPEDEGFHPSEALKKKLAEACQKRGWSEEYLIERILGDKVGEYNYQPLAKGSST